MERRDYTQDGVGFVLEPISDAMARFTHGDQTGYFGVIALGGHPNRPYCWTRLASLVRQEGLAAGAYTAGVGPADLSVRPATRFLRERCASPGSGRALAQYRP